MKTVRWVFGCGLLTIALLTRADSSSIFLPPPVAPYEGGTFWLLSQSNYPPIPYNPFPELPLYELEDGSFAVDDRQVDYEAYRNQYDMERSLRQMEWQMGISYSMEGMEGEGGPPAPSGSEGGGGSYSPPDLPPPIFLTTTELALLPPLFTNLTSTTLTATNTQPGARYDLFAVTNLSVTNWTWLVRGGPGQTNWFLNGVPALQSYYQLGTMLDSDGDGLTDAYEGLVSKTLPGVFNSLDSDGDGVPDAWEVARGTKPMLADGGADPDMDGLSNLQEYRGATDPQLAAAWTAWVAMPAGVSHLP